MRTDAFTFWEEQRPLFHEGFVAAVSAGNHPLAAVNLEAALEDTEMACMCGWKSGKDVSRHMAALAEYQRLGLGLGEAARAIDPFPSFLLLLAHAAPVDRGLVSAWIATREFRPSERFEVDLCLALLDGKELEYTPRYRNRLWADSMACYQRLVAMGLKSDPQFGEQVDVALELYARREKDAHFVGGTCIEGGGDYNAEIFDFRLAAIVRRYSRCLTSFPPALSFMAATDVPLPIR